MATLTKHGTELGRLQCVRYTKAYYANGDILINRGDGWKIYGSVKPGYNPYETYDKAVNNQRTKLRDHPSYAAWHDAIMQYGLSKRQYIITAIELMPDDPDGVWSELTDTYDYRARMTWTIDEVVELCNLYKNALAEMNNVKQEVG